MEDAVTRLIDRGIKIVDPRQTFIDDDVVVSRISPAATFYPGVRLSGARTLIGSGVILGREGPAVLINTAVGSRTSVASGFLEDAVVLEDASIGANCHIRAGCVLEEQVKTGHCVGLKQSVLLSFVTLGSIINFCDVLMGGGTSRQDHSEVGSGFIHFNFTPWGKHGGKATPWLFGDVVSGVFLRSARIFLGGSGGVVGPKTVGYGSVVAAGQVVRQDVAPGRLVLRPAVATDREVAPQRLNNVQEVRERNIQFLSQLHALRMWYELVRRARARISTNPEFELALITEATKNIDYCIAERFAHLSVFLEENGLPPLRTPQSCDVE